MPSAEGVARYVFAVFKRRGSRNCPPTPVARMSPPDSKLWLFLDETLRAEEGLSLLGTIVADVQHPTNRYEPKLPLQSGQQPYLQPGDLLEPYFEDSTITAGTNSGSAFGTGLYGFISGNTNSSNSRQAEILSAGITTHALRSPDDVFKKIRNDAKYWQRVEDLMRTSDTKKLYFVCGYKTATDPVITLQTSKQRSHGAEVTLPVAQAVTGGLNSPIGNLGDPRLAGSIERGSMASQSRLVKGERLFAIQYWTLVKKRETQQRPKRKYFNWPKSNRTDGIQAKAPSGKHIMFHGGDDSEEDDEEEDEDEDEEEDRDEWGIVECRIDAPAQGTEEKGRPS